MVTTSVADVCVCLVVMFLKRLCSTTDNQGERERFIQFKEKSEEGSETEGVVSACHHYDD